MIEFYEYLNLLDRKEELRKKLVELREQLYFVHNKEGKHKLILEEKTIQQELGKIIYRIRDYETERGIENDKYKGK